jgi:hypothetical protein
MGTVPETYYQFVMDYAPNVYVIPPSTPDPAFGKGVLAASFAIDFLYDAYSAQQFEDRKTDIHAKIVDLADWVLTQQCNDPAKKAYGGFKSSETSTYYYSVDACRAIPALLRTYELTGDNRYLDAAKLAAATYLKTMQDQQAYGGFARAVRLAMLGFQPTSNALRLNRLKDASRNFDTSNIFIYQSIVSLALVSEGSLRICGWILTLQRANAPSWLEENEIYDDHSPMHCWFVCGWDGV